MKQARRWLLFAAALVLLPQGAYAQKKKPPKGGDAPTGTGTTSGPVNMDADQPATASPPSPAGAEPSTPPTGGAGVEGGITGPSAGGMDICQVTPDAPSCQAQKEVNLAAEAKK